MKEKSTLIFLLIIFVIAASWLALHVRNKSVIPKLLIEEEVNLGNVVLTSTKEFEIQITNLTEKDFEIAKVYTSCGCTKVVGEETGITSFPIKQGESVAVKIVFDPGSMHQKDDSINHEVYFLVTSPVEKEYKVKGIVGTQGFSIVSQSVYISKKEAENILGIDDKASAILVRLNNKNDADRIKNLILESGIPNADMKTWEEASTFTQGIKQTFGIVTIVTTFVAVVVVVSTIGIVVFINTARKKRIIGVLKAIGMQKNEIMMVFLFESLLFGVTGTVIGAGIVYVALFYLSLNPILLPLGALVPVLYTETAIISAAILIVSSVIAGYLPARMASRQEVLETIRVVE